ncbi:ABC transporter ATP-binding protein [Fusibacillus kribbianus]|uniref:ABC-type quaternary amine transporter n=1 Tax=Fusibacillus kribbianus TaxID=3044208 RepID=A0AAP4B8A2_9FIRM|nr:ABC transporter ATP-binding protein [Ruminococcus sp. YH-rum2234]MDI9241771.1 ABC transporter ATP-binding protein [Ruminococcus sp. YH-rum2234]
MIEYRNVKKYYGDKEIIRDVSFTVSKGEFVVIIGPSGCGKTTTVKMLNRLIDASEGEILIDGVNNKDIDLIKLRTSIGYVIQQIGLFPNMTVEENISVVPKIMKWDKEKTLNRVKELLDMVNMPYNEYGKKYPKQLSGGQQQRIGVLRALAVNPPIIIMDEPFGALDPITREILQSEVKKIQKELNITVLFITHDMHEAMKLADRIIFMSGGEILQQASPKEMFLHPANEEISRFMSLQEVSLKENEITAADLMQSLSSPVCAEGAVVVPAEETLENMGRQYDLSSQNKLYVKDEEGQIVGIITVESMIRHFTKQV